MIKKYTKSILYNTFVIYSISLSNALYVWYSHATHRKIMQTCSIACSFYNYEHIDDFFSKMTGPSSLTLCLQGTLLDIKEWLIQEPACYIDCSAYKENNSYIVTPKLCVPKSLIITAIKPEQFLIKVSHA